MNKLHNNSKSSAVKFFRIFNNSSAVSFLILLLFLIVNMIVQPNFFSYPTLKTSLLVFTPLILVAIAQGIIIISGSIDLSLGSAISLFNVITAFLLTKGGQIWWVVLVGFIFMFITSGLLNGIFIGRLRLNPLITTFATSAVFLGIARIILPSGDHSVVSTSLYKLYTSSFFKFIPFPTIILVFGLIIWIVFSKTRTYRYIYAVGSNEEGAFASGISIWKIRLITHLFASIFIALAGLCVLMLTSTGDYRTGGSYTMNSIASVVIGGVALAGGRGGIIGVIFGAIILGVLNNIIFYSQASTYSQILAKGLVIVFAICLGVIPGLLRNRKKIQYGE